MIELLSSKYLWLSSFGFEAALVVQAEFTISALRSLIPTAKLTAIRKPGRRLPPEGTRSQIISVHQVTLDPQLVYG